MRPEVNKKRVSQCIQDEDDPHIGSIDIEKGNVQVRCTLNKSMNEYINKVMPGPISRDAGTRH